MALSWVDFWLGAFAGREGLHLPSPIYVHDAHAPRRQRLQHGRPCLRAPCSQFGCGSRARACAAQGQPAESPWPGGRWNRPPAAHGRENGHMPPTRGSGEGRPEACSGPREGECMSGMATQVQACACASEQSRACACDPRGLQGAACVRPVAVNRPAAVIGALKDAVMEGEATKVGSWVSVGCCGDRGHRPGRRSVSTTCAGLAGQGQSPRPCPPPRLLQAFRRFGSSFTTALSRKRPM